MADDIKYIKEHFIEWEALCRAVNMSSQELNTMIEKELAPSPSYVIESTNKITSPLEGIVEASDSEKYFPKHIKALIKANRNIEKPIDFKNKVKAEFINTFTESKDKHYGYDTIINDDGSINMEKLDMAFEQEWQNYLKGIYGICTLNATGADIAKKELAVKKLIEFNKKYSDKKLTENEKQLLIKLNAQYNEVSNLFAPYQRETSSRGKYLDSLLKSNDLNELIKKYN